MRVVQFDQIMPRPGASAAGARAIASPFADPQFWLMAGVGTCLSIVVSGFVFGIFNDDNYLPILNRLYDEPQFASDEFVQSLRYFASGLWLLLAGSSKYVDTWWLFLTLFVLSRLLCFVGFLACADFFGISRWRERLLFVVLLSVAASMRVYSYAGSGGLFNDYFTHSEVPNGLFLLSLYAAVNRRVAVAMVVVGIIAFVNVFFAVWTTAIVGCIFAFQVFRRELSMRRTLVEGTIGTVLIIAIMTPVIVNILSNPQFGIHLPFDYTVYLIEYYPNHFLFAPISVDQKVRLAMVAAVGLAAFVCSRTAPALRVAYLACFVLYAVGIVVPSFTHSPNILNLHLLRSSTLIHLLAALASCGLITQWWFHGSRIRAAILAPLLVVCVAAPGTGSIVLVAMPLFVCVVVADWLFSRRGSATTGSGQFADEPRGRFAMPGQALRWAALGYVACLVPLLGYETFARHSRIDSWRAEWDAVADWASANTATNAVFMLPPDVYKPGQSLADISFFDTGFDFRSHRGVWVTFRRGASVMWWPDYYAIWHQRVADIVRLNTQDEKIRYAQDNHIAYFVDVADRGCLHQAAFQTADLCVYKVPGAS